MYKSNSSPCSIDLGVCANSSSLYSEDWNQPAWYFELGSFFPKIILVILGPFDFHINFRICFSVSAIKTAGVLVGVMLSLYVTIGRTDVFTVLNLPVQDHGFSPYIFRCSFIFFSQQYFIVSLLFSLQILYHILYIYPYMSVFCLSLDFCHPLVFSSPGYLVRCHES